MQRLVLLVLMAAPVAADRPAYELPADPRAPVLTIDYRNGIGPPRKNNDPYLSILADGTILAEHVKPGTRLSADELQELLRFVIKKHGMLTFDRKAVEAKARKLSDAYITDQLDTIVTIAIKGRRRKVTYNASTWAVQTFPSVKELQSLEAVRKRLHSIWCTAQLGRAETKRLLGLANRALKKKYPHAPALTMQDLYWVYREKAGLRRLHIANWHPKGATGAIVNLPAKGKPSVEPYVEKR